MQYVKGNFLPGRVFSSITTLNYEARRWCYQHNNRYHKATDCIPSQVHKDSCLNVARPFSVTQDIRFYLCPERSISFDGFVNYEGRRFGVPYTYTGRTCRVMRNDYTLYIYSADLSQELARHNVTWSRKDSFCENQFSPNQPEEFPTAVITSHMKGVPSVDYDHRFSQFNFDKEVGC